jgi:hypothetical protein
VFTAFVLIFSASFLARALLGAVDRGNGNAASLIKQAPFPISPAEEFLIRTPTGSCGRLCACIQSVALQMEQRNAAERRLVCMQTTRALESALLHSISRENCCFGTKN